MLSDKSIAKLTTVDSRLREVVMAVAIVLPFPIVVIYGFRGQADQEKAFQLGKSKLRWPKSKHNRKPSLAVDLAPLNIDTGQIDWNDIAAFDVLAETMLAKGAELGHVIRWGMDWDMDGIRREKRTWEWDGPHFEIVEKGETINGKIIA